MKQLKVNMSKQHRCALRDTFNCCTNNTAVEIFRKSIRHHTEDHFLKNNNSLNTFRPHDIVSEKGLLNYKKI